MKSIVPEYRHKQLAEAVASYGLAYDDYTLRIYSPSGPDSAYYFFEGTSGDIVVFYTEDYVSGLDYVKTCLSENIFAAIKQLHKVQKPAKHGFDHRAPVKNADYYEKPKDADTLLEYAVDFASLDFGFLATVEPLDSESFWQKNAELDWLI